MARRGRRPAIGVLLALCAAWFGPPTAASAAAPTSPPRSAPVLTWQDCGFGFQCATLRVPLDYAKPRRASIGIALIRRPAEDPTRRVGSLVTNPGGPGESGIQDLRVSAAQYPPELRARFDLVSFDPRGVGMSSPVHCLDPLHLAAFNELDLNADTPDEVNAVLSSQRELARACEAAAGRLLPFMSTEATARDLDRIRAALGDPKLTFFGASYGTYLGAVYAQLFPKRVRALMLDGAVDPALPSYRLATEQAVGYEQGLQAFLADCAARPDCPLRRRGDPAAVFDAVLTQADQSGIPAPRMGNRRLTAADAQTAVTGLLSTGEPLRTAFAVALANAASGDASLLLSVADAFNQAIDVSANQAIACLGPFHLSRRDLSGLASAAAQARARAPHFGLAMVYGAAGCAVWPVHDGRPGAIHAKGAPPILVIGTEGDPTTPLPWAQALAKELRSGVLLIAPGHTHTSFALERYSTPNITIPVKQCVDDIGIRYLVDLTVPASGMRCA